MAKPFFLLSTVNGLGQLVLVLGKGFVSVVRDSYEIFTYNNSTETRHMIHRCNRQEMLYLTSSIPKYLGSL